jgi:hypothetical protein
MAPNLKLKIAKLLDLKTKDYFNEFWTSYFITGFGKTLPINYNLDKFLKDLYDKDGKERNIGNYKK